MTHPLFIEQNDCTSCYKCIRVCPTKSISFQDKQASILKDECVLCGSCYSACPQKCIAVRNDIALAKDLLSRGNCYASLAPSFLASYPKTSIDTFRRALQRLGFADVEETAIGATIVKKAYDELVAQSADGIFISTSCPAVNRLIQKHYPAAAKYLCPVLSPMQAHAKDLKKRHPGASVIFIGPCIAKKGEVDAYPGTADLALTYPELDQMLKEAEIVVEKEPNHLRVEESKARLFPTDGGILATMEKSNPSYQYVSVSGMEQCISAIEDLLSGEITRVFCELSACEGGCIAGPTILARNIVKTLIRVRASAGESDFPVAPYTLKEIHKEMPGFAKPAQKFSEGQIQEVLHHLGKTSPKDELNCASCGYPTCREKAIAVLSGKANKEMCLPYLMGRATSFANDVIETSSNAIVVVDEGFDVQLANPVLCRILGIKQEDIIHANLADYLDVTLFADAMAGNSSLGKHIQWEQYGVYVEATIRYDERYHIIVGIFRDRTKTQEAQLRQQAQAQAAREVTRDVIEKNMRAVQEIAQLLGESAAETKIALTNLSDALEKGDIHGKP